MPIARTTTRVAVRSTTMLGEAVALAEGGAVSGGKVGRAIVGVGDTAAIPDGDALGSAPSPARPV
jgi:hypothetical protein